jgi:hypothetical protein
VSPFLDVPLTSGRGGSDPPGRNRVGGFADPRHDRVLEFRPVVHRRGASPPRCARTSQRGRSRHPGETPEVIPPRGQAPTIRSLEPTRRTASRVSRGRDPAVTGDDPDRAEGPPSGRRRHRTGNHVRQQWVRRGAHPERGSPISVERRATRAVGSLPVPSRPVPSRPVPSRPVPSRPVPASSPTHRPPKVGPRAVVPGGRRTGMAPSRRRAATAPRTAGTLCRVPPTRRIRRGHTLDWVRRRMATSILAEHRGQSCASGRRWPW